jgi:hypothetical protein
MVLFYYTLNENMGIVLLHDGIVLLHDKSL